MSTILINTSQSTVAESVDILVPGAEIYKHKTT